MTIESRIRITTLVLILYAVGLVLVLSWSSHQVGRGISGIETASQINRSAFMLRVLMKDYLEQGNKRILGQWDEQNLRLGRLLDEGQLSESLDTALLEGIRQRYQAVNHLYPRLIEMRASTETGDLNHDVTATKMLSALMFLQLEQLVHTANDLSMTTQTLTLKKRNFVGSLIVALGILAVMVILVNIHLIRRSVVYPLQMLSKGAESVGAGDLELVPETKSDDEVGKLTLAFNTMIAGLRKRTSDLKNAHSELELRIEERTAAYEQVRTQNDLLQAVLRAQTQFISFANPQELFRNLLHDLLTSTDSEFGFIGEIINTSEGEIYLKDRAIADISWDGESRKTYQKFADEKGLDFPIIRGLWGDVVRTGNPVISNDPANDPRRGGLPEGHPPLSSFLGLPFRSDGEVIGVAGIANRPGGYTQELVDFLQPYLATCANIIEAYRNENRRKAAEAELVLAYAQLEQRVLDRTAELESANERLVREIDERKRAEQSATTERQRFNEVLEILPAYVVLLAPDYHVPFANRFFEERFGKSGGKRCFEYLFGRTEPCEVCETYTVLKTNAPHHWEWTGPDGRNYDIHDFPFADTDASPLIMEVGIDITEQKSAEAEREKLITELETKNAELERFIYSVSHDLKSPLITIMTFLGFIEHAIAEGHTDNLNTDLERISRAASKMGQLLDEVLELSRIGRMFNPPTEIPMRDLVDEAVELVSGRIAQRGVKITIAPDLPVLYGDHPRLLDILQNLIENAVKFMGDQPNPEIEIGAREEAGETVLYVGDNGIGIEACYHERIFRLFDKLDQKTEGTGIGLALVKRIVEIHNGRIWVETEGIGKGSTFCFTLSHTVRVDDGEKLT